MIDNIASSGVHAADVAAARQNRARKTDTAADTGKPAHPAHPHGHIPPGLARAAEKIASKIFERADADKSGSVTQEELSAVHSKHARFLASSALFETPAEPATETTTQTGVTEAQLKEALTKFFYAKVGAIYTLPTSETPESPAVQNEEPPLIAVA